MGKFSGKATLTFSFCLHSQWGKEFAPLGTNSNLEELTLISSRKSLGKQTGSHESCFPLQTRLKTWRCVHSPIETIKKIFNQANYCQHRKRVRSVLNIIRKRRCRECLVLLYIKFVRQDQKTHRNGRLLEPLCVFSSSMKS